MDFVFLIFMFLSRVTQKRYCGTIFFNSVGFWMIDYGCIVELHSALDE